MSRITIKIIDIDRAANNIIVQYASDASAKPIDEYPAMGFQITDPKIKTPEEFIESIRYQISHYAAVRDAMEAYTGELDFSAWSGFTTEFEASLLVSAAPAAVDALASPEVIL